MSKDNSRILTMIEKGKTSQEIRRATRAPIMRIAGVRAAHTRYGKSRKELPASGRKIPMPTGSNVHNLVIALLRKGVDTKVIAAASGNSIHVIRGIKARM